MKSNSGNIETIVVPSLALSTDKLVKIYTPFGYNNVQKYPVLYIFHGGAGDEDSWMPKLGLEARADQLIHDKKITPLIIVAPQMGQGYASGGNETFISQELIEYIDKHYSTNPARESRYIGGLSIGGFIALHHAFYRSDLFSKVGGHSAYLYTEVGLNDSVENPILTAQNRDLTDLQVYLDAGIFDPYNLVATNAELLRILRAKGVPSVNYPNTGGHDSDYWRGNIDKYLAFYVGMKSE